MRRSVLALALVLLMSLPASAATWVSGTVASIEKYGDGQLLIVVVWTDDVGMTEKGSLVAPATNATAVIQSELARRNAADSAIADNLKVGTIVRVPASIQPPAPTQEDIDVAAFTVLVKVWQAEIAKLTAKIGSQEAIDAAAQLLAAPYAAANAATRARYNTILVAALRFPL